MSSIKKLLLSIALLILIGCTGKDSEIVSPIETQNILSSIIPLNFGNYWNYQVYNGNVFSESKLMISGKSIINGIEWYLLKDTINNRSYYISNKMDGLHADGLEGIDHLICKYPANIEDSWADSIYTYSADKGMILESVTKYTLTSKKAYVVVPSGTFTCYGYDVVHTDIDMLKIYLGGIFYCPGVGKISEEYINNSTQERYGSKLVSYKVN